MYVGSWQEGLHAAIQRLLVNNPTSRTLQAIGNVTQTCNQILLLKVRLLDSRPHPQTMRKLSRTHSSDHCHTSAPSDVSWLALTHGLPAERTRGRHSQIVAPHGGRVDTRGIRQMKVALDGPFLSG